LQYTRDLLLWRLGLRSPPHFVKARHLRRLQKKHGLSVFVESGTYLGEMVEAVKSSFQEIYSIEVDAALFQYARARFTSDEKIHIFHGDAAEVLPDILRTISVPCLFWLDGHFSGGVTGMGKRETQIVDELLAIKKYYIPGHVVLVDDADSFTGEGDYPTLGWVDDVIHAMDPKMRVEVTDNIICAEPPEALESLAP